VPQSARSQRCIIIFRADEEMSVATGPSNRRRWADFGFAGCGVAAPKLALFPLMLAQADAGAAAVLVDELDAGSL
jgi:hypothetical protein